MISQLAQLIELFAEKSPDPKLTGQLRDFVSGREHWHTVWGVAARAEGGHGRQNRTATRQRQRFINS